MKSHLERQHRDKGTESLIDYQHYLFEPKLLCSQELKNVLKFRTCKRNLTDSVACSINLDRNSRFITAGAFRRTLQDKAVMVYANNKVEIFLINLFTCSMDPETNLHLWSSSFCNVGANEVAEPLESSVEDRDMRVWLHCKTCWY